MNDYIEQTPMPTAETRTKFNLRPSENGSLVSERIPTEYGNMYLAINNDQNRNEWHERLYLEQDDRASYNQDQSVLIIGETEDDGKPKLLGLKDAFDQGYNLIKIYLEDLPKEKWNKIQAALISKSGSGLKYSLGMFPDAETKNLESWPTMAGLSINGEDQDPQGNRIETIAIRDLDELDKISIDFQEVNTNL